MPVVQKIGADEQKTFNYYFNRGEMKKGNFHGLEVINFKPKNSSDYYYKSKVKKQKIVLHYTVGYLGGDLANLTRNNFHVSVPFIIARDGQIIQLYDPEHWSYHLTPNAVGGNKLNSSRSIAIELTGMGPLDKSANWMFNYYGSKYCKASEKEHYIDHGKEYRGYRYFSKFTDQQYVSLKKLLGVLTQVYDIPYKYLPPSERYDLFPKASTAREYRGICSHVNFQPAAVKNDIGPAFDWARISP